MSQQLRGNPAQQPARRPMSGKATSEPYAGVRRTTIQGEQATVALYEFEPGARFPWHQHPQEQITLVLDGSIVAGAGDQEWELGAGESFVTAPQEPHGIAAKENGARFVAVIAPARGSEDEIVVLAPPS